MSTVSIQRTLLYYGTDICKYHILLKQRRVAGETGLLKALGRKRKDSRVCVVLALKQSITTGLAGGFMGNLAAFEACHVLSGYDQGKWEREQTWGRSLFVHGTPHCNSRARRTFSTCRLSSIEGRGFGHVRDTDHDYLVFKCLFTCTGQHVCGCLWRLAKGVRTSLAGVTGRCGLPDLGAGN